MEIEKGEIITLSNGREYVCLSTIMPKDNNKYLYLMAASGPIEFCFAEETVINDTVRMRVVGGRDEKYRLFDLLKNQLKTDSNRGVYYA